MKNLPLEKVYALIEPGPVVLLSTARKSRANVMTMSWHMMLEFEPPMLSCVVSAGNYSFAALRATKECVIAIPGVAMARTVVDIGNCSGREVDKFAKFGLTAVPAALVAAPLIGECQVNLECRVTDTKMVNKYNMFVLEVVKAERSGAEGPADHSSSRVWDVCGGWRGDQTALENALKEKVFAPRGLIGRPGTPCRGFLNVNQRPAIAGEIMGTYNIAVLVGSLRQDSVQPEARQRAGAANAGGFFIRTGGDRRFTAV